MTDAVDEKVLDTRVDEKVDVPEPTPDEAKASGRGWKPKDKFIEDGGDEAEWKPAKAFNEYGELKDKLISTEKDLKKTNKVIAIMRDHHLNVRQQAYQEALKDLKVQREEALKEENFAAAEKIRDQIDEVKDQFKKNDALPAAVEAEVAQINQEPDPEFHAFMDRNPWYRPGGKDEMSKKADALGYAYANQIKGETGRIPSFKEVIEVVEKDIRRMYPDKFEKHKSPVNDNGNRKGGDSSSKKVSLSAEELEVAKGFGMTPEAYAAQKAKYKGRD